MTRHQRPDTRGILPFADLADLQAEAAKKAAQAQLDVAHLGLQLLAGNKKSANLLSRSRLVVHGPEPSHPQKLGDPPRIAAIRFHDHGRQRRLHVPRFQQNRIVTCSGQADVQPLRQGSSFKSNPCQREVESGKEAGQRVRLARNLDFPNDLSRPVDRADAALFQ